MKTSGRANSPLQRVLVLAPTGRDASLACSVLSGAGFECEQCSRIDDFIHLLGEGAAAGLVAAEALKAEAVEKLAGVLEEQPPWSDFPFVVLTGAGTPQVASLDHGAMLKGLGNVTLLERPISAITLISAMQSAVRARSRQYEIRKYIDEVRAAESEQAKSLAREQAARAEAEVLNNVGQILSAELSLESLLQAIIDAATKLSRAEFGAFFYDRLDEAGGYCIVDSISGLTREAFTGLPVPGAAPAYSALQKPQILRLDDISKDAHATQLGGCALAAGLAAKSYLAVPVMSRSGDVLGGLFFGHSRPAVFAEREERLVIGLAAQAAIAIDNARLFETTERERKRAEAAKLALERSNDELQQFAYVASHDLQEPLRTVASYTQLLARRYESHLDQDGHDFIGFIVEGVNRMSALINDLLEYSRAGKAGERPLEPVSAEAVLQDALFGLRAGIEEAGAQVTYDPLPEVNFDRRQFLQLFQNLIGNAIKYRSDNALRIHVSAEGRDSEWVFSVADNGIGIKPQYHDRIFGVFKRLHGKDVPGTGIGLAICKRLLEQNGGRIWVESKLDCGSTFYFAIPRACERDGPAASHRGAGAPVAESSST